MAVFERATPQTRDAESDEDWDEIGPRAQKQPESKLRELAKDGQ